MYFITDDDQSFDDENEDFHGDSDEDYPPRQSTPILEINSNQEVCINCNSNIIITLQ